MVIPFVVISGVGRIVTLIIFKLLSVAIIVPVRFLAIRLILAGPMFTVVFPVDRRGISGTRFGIPHHMRLAES